MTETSCLTTPMWRTSSALQPVPAHTRRNSNMNWKSNFSQLLLTLLAEALIQSDWSSFHTEYGTGSVCSWKPYLKFKIHKVSVWRKFKLLKPNLAGLTCFCKTECPTLEPKLVCVEYKNKRNKSRWSLNIKSLNIDILTWPLEQAGVSRKHHKNHQSY